MLRIQHIFAISFLTISGCAIKQPLTWRIEGQMLLPPGKPKPVVVKTSAPCPSSEVIATRRKRGGAVLTVRTDVIAKQPPGWLLEWVAGCVAPGDASSVARRVLDSTPAPVNLSYRA